VVMFVPGDNFVSAAFENDPDLFEDGMKNRVLICTPTTFIALMKAISYGWGQEKLAESAAEIGKLGKELYARLAALGGMVAKVGGNLETTVKNYNALVASLEARVMPQARKFNERGVEGTSVPIPELAEVEIAPRLPQPGRDLLMGPQKD
jgi:DNA recombination protein RmuC